ncbi:hypothetical protein PHYBOEH_009156 [Phytophthora boehmeriae]|uniref:Uncharacterized protein n=1 Tax=Phytophthora boehmeriae TaxID=109152 RepID=A0A8T1X291_9STRA|nr:hypothetical protein PHYBOEH_009156 [Phytophthora boehmeriae]
MNLWALNDESVVSQPRRTKTNFADAPSSGGWRDDTPSQRRKQQRGKVEVLVEDHDSNDDNDDLRKSYSASTPRLSSKIETTSRKANEIISADVVKAVDNGSAVTVSSHPPLSSLERRQQNGKKRGDTAKQRLDNGVHHLVREFLLLHNHGDIVKILDKERPMPLLSIKETKKLRRRLTGPEESTNPPEMPSLLECFLVRSNQTQLGMSTKRATTERPASAESTTRATADSASKAESTSPSRTKKPVLNVITSNLGQDISNAGADAVVNTTTESGYNRLNHPGSTPKPQAHETVFGDPGSTPLARAKDLRALGFDDIDDEEADSMSESNEATPDQSKGTGNDAGNDISEYAIRKRAARTAPKNVQLGNAGSTPTKEYIFFRETPPSFVTETIEEAVEVFEKLGNDPDFIQTVVVERFIELNSSEVSKYSVGQQVNGLGAHGDISGVVSKVYGSRLCGSAGPGTIVIDTRPEESPVGV